MNRKLLSFLLVIVMSVIGVNAQFVIHTTNQPCYGQGGYAYITPSSGYVYLWSNGSPYYGTVLHAGIYSCTVSDSSGQQLAVLTDTITNPPPITYTYTTTAPTSCDSCNGSITLIPSGGVPPYVLEWYNSTRDSTNYTYSHACKGLQGVNIQDANQCRDTLIYIAVNCNCGMNVTLAQTNISCDTIYGSVTASVAGGDAPYTYSWNNLGWGGTGSTSSFTNLQTGTIWTLTVSDTAGCKYYAAGNILNSVGYNYFVYVQQVPANCFVLGEAIANVYGNHPPYSYAWSTSPVQTTATATSLPPGNYTVTVTDSLGCLAGATVQVDSGCYETISGTVFVDTTGNCNYNQSSIPVNNVTVQATGASGTYYGYSYNQGQFSIQVADTGTYTLTSYFDYNGECAGTYTICGNPSGTVTLNSYGQTVSNVYIAYAPNSGFDLALHPGYTSAQPGFNKDYWIYFYNNNPRELFTGTATITFQYDPRLVFLSSDVPYTTYNASTQTFTWTATNILFSPWSYIGKIHFYVPTTLSPYDTLISNYRIDPLAGDCDTSNNVMNLTEEVIGSRDPNEKDVQPAGSLSQSDSVLTFTIHFQNTGNATTSFITVVDTLSSSLDPATVVNIASNPQYAKFNISGNGVLTWTFVPAYLPDSLSDPNGSKGFITFTVKLKKDLPLGQAISNTASVYFDYNSPVVTNTVTDTVGFSTGIINPGYQSSVSVKAFPNPFSNTATFVVKGLTDSYDFELLDVTGRLQRKLSSITTNQFTINREGLASGVYLFRISVHNQAAAYGKVVIQ